MLVSTSFEIDQNKFFTFNKLKVVLQCIFGSSYSRAEFTAFRVLLFIKSDFL